MRTQPTASNCPGHTGACADLANMPDHVLVVLEDFLLHADIHMVHELADYALTRPDDPRAWVCWVAALIGEHAVTLRALIPTNEAPPAHSPIGEPR